MSFNKFMHPRNQYVVPPDFKRLAVDYPEFRKHLRQDLSGKLKFNFQDAEALRIFTTTLLHKDFGLTVDIPQDCLVPTLPLRLNYILWIEDLLSANQFEGQVHGIDIGTGASCIYPLLACCTNSWSMLALECDPRSVEYARRNVQQNSMQEFISVKHTSSSDNSHLESYLDPNISYTFTMCNPPFFASSDDLDWEHDKEDNNSKKMESCKYEIDCTEPNLIKSSNSRKRRKPARNAHTGHRIELIAQGGEVSFVKKMIQDNIHLRQIKLFTTMLGHKSSFIQIKHFLMQHPLVKQVSSTELCQGNTMRWGLAWSAGERVYLPSTLHRKECTSKPLVTMLEGRGGGVREVVDKILALCDSLQIIYKILRERGDGSSVRVELTAYQNTWSHQRRLKRKKRRQENGETRAKKHADGVGELLSVNETEWSEVKDDKSEVKDDKSEVKDDKSEVKDDNGGNDRGRYYGSQQNDCKSKYEVQICERVDNECIDGEMEPKDSKISENSVLENERNESNPRTLAESSGLMTKSDRFDNAKESRNGVELKVNSEGNSAAKARGNGTTSSSDSISGNQILVPLVVCDVLIESVEASSSQERRIVIEMIWVSGSGSRDLPHQIMQCFRNNL